MSIGNDICRATERFSLERAPYYEQWMFDHPVCITTKTRSELENLQGILARLIRYYAESYDQYVSVDPRAELILKRVQNKQYRLGTYRTDFVMDKDGQIKLIEITCRYPFNGFFLSSLMNFVACKRHVEMHPSIPFSDPYQAIYPHFEQYFTPSREVVIITGSDKRNESKIYVDVLENAGFSVITLGTNEIGSKLPNFSDPLVICELSFEEWFSINEADLDILLDTNLINDPRTVFLLHDKRFFVTLGNESFLGAVLNAEEVDFFQRFYAKTYSSQAHPELWQAASLDKNSWIVKHPAKGKSIDIYAGIVTDQKTWEALFDEADDVDWVLQEWVEQNTYSDEIKGSIYQDYLAGTLLYFDDAFYGFGDFRMSSHPVTNKTDHRKACSIILSESSSVSPYPITI